MKRILLTAVIVLFFGEMHAAEEVAVKKEFVKFSLEDHKEKKITCRQMDLLNTVFENHEFAVLRIFMAAIAAKKLITKIDAMVPEYTNEQTGEKLYFLNKKDEIAFIANNIMDILDPVKKFLDDLHDNTKIILVLFEKILGENAKRGFLVKAVNDSDAIEYLLNNITTVEELRSAACEFVIFFSDIKLSLSTGAMDSYNKARNKLSQSQSKNNKK